MSKARPYLTIVAFILAVGGAMASLSNPQQNVFYGIHPLSGRCIAVPETIEEDNCTIGGTYACHVYVTENLDVGLAYHMKQQDYVCELILKRW